MEDRVLVDHKIMITLLSNQGQSLEHDVKAPLFGLLLFQSGSHHAKNMCADIVDIPSIPITALVTAVCTRLHCTVNCNKNLLFDLDGESRAESTTTTF